MILIDNYDSFTYNVVEYLRELGVNPIILKNDQFTINSLKKMSFESVILSPGPGYPKHAGKCLDVIHHFYKTKKILGICLGHQCIAHYFGAKIIPDANPTHGKTSAIFFDDNLLFANMPQGFSATRYHSLIVDNQTLPTEIKPIAWTENGINMGIKHDTYPVFGVQFHPEAILTEYGKILFENFLQI